MQLSFTDVGKLPPPVLQFADVTFGYSPDRVLYRNVSLCFLLLPQMVPAASQSGQQMCCCACMLAIPLKGARPAMLAICHASCCPFRTPAAGTQSG